MKRSIALVTLALLASCRAVTTEPAKPRTVAAARVRVDSLVAQLNWAGRDCFDLGCRYYWAGVQVDSTMPVVLFTVWQH